MVSNEQQNMDIGYKAEFRLIRTDYRRYFSLTNRRRLYENVKW